MNRFTCERFKNTGIRFLCKVAIPLTMLCTVNLSNAAPKKNVFTRRYVYKSTNITNDKYLNEFIEIMRRASAAGYNGMTIGSSKLYEIQKIPSEGLDRFARVLNESKRLNMALVPIAMHQSAPARVDTAVGEAFPVEKTRFVVSGPEARVVADPPISLQNGGFESCANHQPTAWRVVGAVPGKTLFADAAVKHHGGKSIRIDEPAGRTDLRQGGIAVNPFRAYELSVWIKTNNYSQNSKLGFLATGNKRQIILHRRDVCFRTSTNWGGVSKTQNWRKHVIDFNSLENTAISIRLTASMGSGTGTVWFDDVSIREVGLYETMRREGMTIQVRSEDLGTTFTEGKDYRVLAEKLEIPSSSAIPNGASLRVDWYQYANVETSHPSADFCQQQTWDITTETLGILDNLFESPKGMGVYFDEWRVGFWGPTCKGQYTSAADYLAGTMKKHEALVRNNTNVVEVYTWNDMFDPYHNADPTYWMINGSLREAWKGLSKEVVVINWLDPYYFSQKRPGNSARFFAGTDPDYPGFKARQIISTTTAGGAIRWNTILDTLEAEGVNSIIGCRFTTWSNNYNEMEKMADIFRKAGRWSEGPVPWGDMGAAQSQGHPIAAPARLSFCRSTGASQGTIRYSLPEDARVKLTVANTLGQTVASLVDENRMAGTHRMHWNGRGLSAGVYFVRLSIENGAGGNLQRRVVLM